MATDLLFSPYDATHERCTLPTENPLLKATKSKSAGIQILKVAFV